MRSAALRLESVLDPVTHDDPGFRIGPTRRQSRLNVPTFSGFGQFGTLHLVPWETDPCARFSTADTRPPAAPASGASARAVTTSIGSGSVFDKIFDPHRDGPSAGAPVARDRFAQEGRLLGAAFDQMHMRARRVRQRAGDAPGRETRRRSRDRPRSAPAAPAPEAAANRRCAGSTASARWTARSD